MEKIQIGVVPYMNAKPLIYGLENNELVELRFTVPSLLSELLKRGEVDVALVPSIDYLREDNYLVIPNISIASKGEVKSVKLLVRDHPESIKTIALDTASNTSCVLLRIIMREKYRLAPAFIPWNPCKGLIHPKPYDLQFTNETSEADAFLIIGDNALKTNGTSYLTLDLGKEWQDMTYLPFVYAFWATKRETKIPDLKDILNEAKTEGLNNLEKVAQAEAKRIGLTPVECFNYLSKNICYDLGEKELDGLKTFYRYTVKMGLAKEGINIEFYNA